MLATCGTCLRSPPPFHRVHALYHYESPLVPLLLQLKFHQKLNHAPLFGALLVEQVKNQWYCNKPLPTLLIPVPLHVDRLKERGFNQALEIARPIAAHLQLPLSVNRVQRIKPTVAQTTLAPQERMTNMRNAFKVTKTLKHRHIAIIDDVMTTGNTIISLCKTLKKAGATTIDVWCVARAGIMT